jgi:protein arginine kinase
MLDSLVAKIPWIAGTGPQPAVALFSQCSLIRNLAGFAFPGTSSEDEERAVEDRVLSVLESLGMLSRGQYYSVSGIDPREVFLLAERRVAPFDLLNGRVHAGVYVAEDQALSIAVNGANHLCITAIGSGLQLQALHNRINLLDDALAGMLDYAFDKKFGYLTRSISHVGTGLKASVILHLPALAMENGLPPLMQTLRQRRQVLNGQKSTIAAQPPRDPAADETDRGPAPIHHPPSLAEALYYDFSGILYGDFNETQGDLFLLGNQNTLGISEEEILFHLRHSAAEIIDRECETRRGLMERDHRRLEDRVARALGVARSARLLGFSEALSLLSSIRLGVDVGLLKGYSLQRLTELVFASQSAHLKTKADRETNEWTLSIQRADLFRARFGQERNG